MSLAPQVLWSPRTFADSGIIVVDEGLNNGVFYLKVDSSSIDLLTQTIDYPLAHPDEDLGWFGEQAAMANVIRAMESQLQTEGKPAGVAWVPREWFNLYQTDSGFQGEPGHFMAHFPGLGATRLSHMEAWLDELRRDQAKWEIPLERTVYPASIAEFWDNFVTEIESRAE